MSDGNGGWVLQAELPPAANASSGPFNGSVSLSGDTVVFGAPGDTDRGASAGAVYVYTRNGATWSLQAKLTASDTDVQDSFGGCVSISGETLLVGARYADDGAIRPGLAYVFTRSGGIWTQQARLKASNAATYDWFGYSVSLSGDTAIIGAPRLISSPGPGSVYVFRRSGATWAQEAEIADPDVQWGDSFGESVSISGDTAVLSGPGSAYVFARSGANWARQATLAPQAGAEDGFGLYASISGDTIAVGSYLADAAYAFTRDGHNMDPTGEDRCFRSHRGRPLRYKALCLEQHVGRGSLI